MGSTLVCKADSVDEIKGHLSKDVYAISGVWDLEKVHTQHSIAIRHRHHTDIECRSRFIPSNVLSDMPWINYLVKNTLSQA